MAGVLLGTSASPAMTATFAPVDGPGPALTAPAAALAASVKCICDLKGSAREPVLLLTATGVNSDQSFAYKHEKAVLGHSQGGMVMRWSLRFWPDTRAMVADVIGMAGSN